jgi:hypothetical protein
MVSPPDNYKRKRPLGSHGQRSVTIFRRRKNHELSLDRMIADEEAEDTRDTDEDLAEPINCMELARKRGTGRPGMIGRKEGIKQLRCSGVMRRITLEGAHHGHTPAYMCFPKASPIGYLRERPDTLPKKYPSFNIPSGIRGAETPPKPASILTPHAPAGN